ncbi:metal-dependent hydrolase [bacterium]|nr:metal-dependent hydrolase [bacterium]MCI0605733.1 metal-dependent hydrolase [bacterium]
MDPVTHGLAGALIAEAGFTQRLGTRCRYVLATAAIFPDIDILYRFDGLPAYIANHRGITHSFLGVLASGLLFGAIFGRFDEERRYLPWIAASWVALFSHQILDLITSYGTVVLYPFSQTRFYFDWVFILDWILTGTLLVSLILARLKPSRATRRARMGLWIASGYIVFCALNHTVALHQLEMAAKQNRIPFQRAAAIPQPFVPLRWSGILDAGLHYYQVPFFSFLKPEPPFQVFTKTTGSYFEQIARSSEMGSLYFWFARYPVVQEKVQGRIHVIEFSDLRFYIRLHRFPVRKPFVLHFRIDEAGNILESRFTRM